jgi:hypothetical protein
MRPQFSPRIGAPSQPYSAAGRKSHLRRLWVAIGEGYAEGKSMLLRILQLSVVGLLLVLGGVALFLDLLGYAETVEK